MKTILSLCVFVSLLLGGEVHFSFYDHTYQRFEIPYDETFRAYMTPIDLVGDGQTPLLKMIFTGCHEGVFRIDDIRFPSNAYIDFESGLPPLSYSSGISQAVLIQHPSDSGYVLQIEFDPNHYQTDTLRIAHPDSWYPAVPERVGVVFQADASVQLSNYYEPPELARFDVNVDDWGFTTVLVEKSNEMITEDSTICTLRRRHFPSEGSHEVYVSHQTYRHAHTRQNILELDGMTFDFTSPNDEPAGGDTTWGSWLVYEQYQEVFGEILFVKTMSPFGPIGHNLYFAYGVGLIREDIPGTSVHVDLMGAQREGVELGELNLPIGLSLSIDEEGLGIALLLPDTNWYYYSIPFSEFYRDNSTPVQLDSLLFTLSPHILVRNHDSGSLLFNQLSIWENENMVFNYGTQNVNNWILNLATNGSDMGWQSSQEIPPDQNVLSKRLDFDNTWLGGEHFAGFAEYSTHFDSPITVDDATLRFWMKQPYIMTDIDIYEPLLPEDYGITAAYPNPFNRQITLTVDIPVEMEDPQLVIYDLKGREVWSQSAHTQMGEKYSWDGKNLSGQKMDSGLYIVTLQSEGRTLGQSQKIIMLK